MRTLEEVEQFLAEESAKHLGEEGYPIDCDREGKVQWLLANADYTRRMVFKMRDVGRKTWANFLWAFGLEERTVLDRTKDERKDQEI